MASLVTSAKCLMKILIPALYKKCENSEHLLPNPFCEASITLLVKSDKDITKNENYKAIFLINTETKMLTKY